MLEYDYAYDNLDRVTSVVDTANTAANINLPSSLPTVAVTLSATYKTNGDLKQTFAKIGSVADYSNLFAYDNLGRLTQVVQRQFTSGEQTNYGATSTNTFTRKRVNLAYNAAGQFSKIIRMSGASGAETETATSVYGYFNGGAVKQIEHWHSGANSASAAPASLGSSISSYSWTFDTHGRASSVTAPEGTFVYGYDDTHELISATFTVASGWTGGTPATESFSFDNTGNRTGGGNSVDKNRLMSDGTYNYTYDGEGNRTSRTNIATTETILYSWDHRNRLTKVEYRNTPTGPATKIVANTYDAFDRRVMKQVDANGDGDQISLVLDANGAVLHRFLHGPAIDQVFADKDSESPCRYVTSVLIQGTLSIVRVVIIASKKSPQTGCCFSESS